MALITYAFRYARPAHVETKEIRHEDSHIEITRWEDSQIDELVRDLASAYNSLSNDYHLFYSGGYDKDHNLRLGEFSGFDEFVRWLSSLDATHDTKRNRKINSELGLTMREFLYESMYHGKANDNSRVVRLKPIVPLVLSRETAYDLGNCPEADFYEAWPLEHWLTDGLNRPDGLKGRMEKLEEMIRRYS